MENIWLEKYRPKEFSEIVGQDEIIKAIKSRVGDNPQLCNLPHLIFEGKAGTGKTTTAKVIAEMLDTDFMELNSSEERGIDTVRGKIMSFCKHLSFHVEAPFKILFLDEMDSMTSDAQLALRPMMERYAHNTRFFIGCNYLDKIIQPIQSRCKVYRFRPVDEGNIVKRLKYIAEKENIFISMAEEDFEELARSSRGDMRKAINSLQMGDYGHSDTEQVFTL